MSEQADRPLHDWVRQSLDTYRPDYNPHDWINLRRALRRRRWQRWGIWGCMVLLVSFVGWFIVPSQSFKAKPIVTTNQSKAVNTTKSVSGSLVTKPQVHRLPGIERSRLAVPMTSQSSPLRTVITPSLIQRVPQLSQQATQLTGLIPQRHPVGFSPEENLIAEQVLTNTIGSDSTSYRVLSRNLKTWPNAVIICDFTTSMYPYSTQLFAWFKQHAKHPSIKGMVFFTDCDSLGRQTQPDGPPGQMFVTHGENSTQVLPTLLAAARNTVHNNDDAENDIEALLYAQKQFPEASHLILVADNISRVKDIFLLNNVKKPVHVILCGTTGSDTTIAYQPDYYSIARQTSGSLHTLEDDINPVTLTNTTTLRVGDRYFRYLPRKHRFKPTTSTHRPRRVLKFIWL